jgi:hypothetical protein
VSKRAIVAVNSSAESDELYAAELESEDAIGYVAPPGVAGIEFVQEHQSVWFIGHQQRRILTQCIEVGKMSQLYMFAA